MASLTVRNIPEDAKHRFRQVAAAHGRSMEEHLRQLVIDADIKGETSAQGVKDVKQSFTHFEPESLPHYAQKGRTEEAVPAERIRAMSSGEFFKYLREIADGVELELPPRTNFPQDREVFGAG